MVGLYTDTQLVVTKVAVEKVGIEHLVVVSKCKTRSVECPVEI